MKFNFNSSEVARGSDDLPIGTDDIHISSLEMIHLMINESFKQADSDHSGRNLWNVCVIRNSYPIMYR